MVVKTIRLLVQRVSSLSTLLYLLSTTPRVMACNQKARREWEKRKVSQNRI
jgi:hypothetical protein